MTTTAAAIGRPGVREVAVGAAAGAGAVVVCSWAVRAARRRSRRRELAALGQRQALRRDAGWAAELPATLEEVGGARSEEILRLTAVELLAEMDAGRLTSRETVSVYIRRAREVGQELNCVTEEMFDEALAAAAEADRLRAQGVRSGADKPLLGLPVSIKDQFDQGGHVTTIGAAAHCAAPCESDGLLVALLKDAGAVPFVRTNVPQCLMLPESDNLIYGRTKNPYNAERTAGGSSGGEGSLIASAGSVLGVGTDIGGSIRIPAAFCGVFGFKPTMHRVSRSGLCSSRRPGMESGFDAIVTAAGPMARSAGDLSLVMRAWLRPAMFTADRATPPVPWRDALVEETALAKKLRFGFYDSDGFFEPCATAKRAVAEVVAALRAAGHEVVAFDPPAVAPAVLNYYRLNAAEGGMRNFVEGLQGEDLLGMYKSLYRMANTPQWLRPVLAAVLDLLGQHRPAALMRAACAQNAYEFQENIHAMYAYQKAWLEAWGEAKLDALITPGPAVPALPHGMSKDLTPSFSYTMLFNLLRFPAGTVPVTTVLSSEARYEPPPGQQDLFGFKAASAMEGAAGLPVGVQVVGLPFDDEQTIGAMQVVERALGRER